MIKKGVHIIDVGINRIEINNNGQKKMILVGDVNYNEAAKNASAISPVPAFPGAL